MPVDVAADEAPSPTDAKDPPTTFWSRLKADVEARAEAQRVARAERRNRPQPWIMRKLAVFMVFALLIYAYYVFVGRFCVRMIRREHKAKGSRGQGVAYLVIFNVLYLVLLWAYFRAIFTPAGTARDFTEKCAPPEPQFTNPDTYGQETSIYSDDSFSLRGGPPYSPSHRDTEGRGSARSRSPSLEHRHEDSETRGRADLERGSIEASNPPHSHHPHPHPHPQLHSPPPVPPPEARTKSPKRAEPKASIDTSPESHMTQPTVVASASELNPESAAQAYARSYVETLRSGGSRPSLLAHPTSASDNVVELDAIPAIAEMHAPDPQIYGSSGTGDGGRVNSRGMVATTIERKPNMNPVLAPEYRYCWRDEIVKPPRTHHCRICGTCTLMFDHHCPWLGQCVGARNRRFFLIFCFWNTIFCIYVMLTLLVGAVTHTNHVDGLEISLIAIAFLFTTFTFGLTVTHTQLIMMNTTTVEHLSMAGMKRRETAILNAAYEFWEFRAKSDKKAEWDREWGRIGREGNLWWLGDVRKNWEAMMGPSPRYWFFPIGPPFCDGLNFEKNPRFDEYGRWRKREAWPAELR